MQQEGLAVEAQRDEGHAAVPLHIAHADRLDEARRRLGIVAQLLALLVVPQLVHVGEVVEGVGALLGEGWG